MTDPAPETPAPAPAPSNMAKVAEKAKAVVQKVTEIISKYAGTALMVFVASHAVKYFI